MGEIIGLLLGSLLWPWFFSKLLRSMGAHPNAAVWTGYLMAVVGAAAVAAATGYPAGNVGLFVLFGLGWSSWLSRRKAAQTIVPDDRSDEDEDDDDDDPALRNLIENIENKGPAHVEATAGIPGRPSGLVRASAPQPHASDTVAKPTECPGCGEGNDSDAEHCIACGQSLRWRTCAACQQTNVAKARFCKRCGWELATPP